MTEKAPRTDLSYSSEIMTVNVNSDEDSKYEYIYYDDLKAYGQELTRLYGDHGESLRHELAHAICARLVGVENPGLGIEYTRFRNMLVPRRAVTSYPTTISLPRIAFASVAVAPVRPSVVDVKQMLAMGYTSFEQLDESIDNWNADNVGYYIPHSGSLDS